MKQKPAFVFLALFLAGALLPLSGRDRVDFGGYIHVGKDEVQDNIISFGGNVVVEGRIKDSIITFGGSVTLSGEVGDSVVGFGTFITLRSSAVVKGDVATIGGRLEKEPGCAISGDTVYFKGGEVFSKLFKDGWMGFTFIPMILILKAIALPICGISAMVPPVKARRSATRSPAPAPIRSPSSSMTRWAGRPGRPSASVMGPSLTMPPAAPLRRTPSWMMSFSSSGPMGGNRGSRVAAETAFSITSSATFVCRGSMVPMQPRN